MVLKKNAPVKNGSSAPKKSSLSVEGEDVLMMPFIDHLKDLRLCVLKSLIAFLVTSGFCYGYSKNILDFLIEPLAQKMPYKIGRHLIYTDLSEAFLTHFKIACYAGLGLAFPFILFQLWSFIAPGLYKREKAFFLLMCVLSPLLFTLGMAVVYYIIFPLAWAFFLSFQENTSGLAFFSPTLLPLEIEPRISSYLDLSLSMLMAFGICFQLPLVLGVLARLNTIRVDHLQKYRRHVIVGIFIVAALITPPDILSQVLLALPLIGLYEFSIIVIRVFSRTI